MFPPPEDELFTRSKTAQLEAGTLSVSQPDLGKRREVVTAAGVQESEELALLNCRSYRLGCHSQPLRELLSP